MLDSAMRATLGGVPRHASPSAAVVVITSPVPATAPSEPEGQPAVPNTESAKKRVRQTAKRRALNNWRKRRVKDQIKSFLKAVHDRELDAAETEYRKTAALLDRISCTSTMHRNTAARRKSRLAKRLNALRTGAAA